MGFLCHPNKCFECIQYPMIDKYSFVYECGRDSLLALYKQDESDLWQLANEIYDVVGEKVENEIEITDDEAIFFGDCVSRLWMFGLTRKRYVDSYQIQEIISVVKRARVKSMPAIGVVGVIERTFTPIDDFPQCWLEANSVRREDNQSNSSNSKFQRIQKKGDNDQSQLHLGWDIDS